MRSRILRNGVDVGAGVESVGEQGYWVTIHPSAGGAFPLDRAKTRSTAIGREEEVQLTRLDLNGGMKGKDYILPLVDDQDGLFEQSVGTGYWVEAVRSTDWKNENMPNDRSKHVIKPGPSLSACCN